MLSKEVIKHGLFVFASIIISPLLVGIWIEKTWGENESFFKGSSQLLSLAPFRIGTYLRCAFYANACTNVDRENTIGFLTLFSHTDTEIGKHVYIGPQSNIGSCRIGRNCLLGSGVHVLSGRKQHNISDPEKPIRLQGGSYEKITIGENCWIGNQATVMADIGSNTVVAAGAVVVDDLPSGAIVAGNPARVLRLR